MTTRTATRKPIRPARLASPAPRFAPKSRRATTALVSPADAVGLAATAVPGKQATRDSTWYLLLAVIGLLCLIGLLMVLSASSIESLRLNDGAWAFFLRQLMWVGCGAAALTVAARVDYRRWRAVGFVFVVGSVVLLVAVLIPGVGQRVNGSTRWVGIGMFRFQPSEMAKLGVLLFVADLLAKRQNQVDDIRLTLRPIATVVGVVTVLVLIQPDMGTAMITVLIVMVMLFVAGVSIRRMLPLGVATIAGAMVLAMTAEYRRDRLLGFLNPWSDSAKTGYQLTQSLVAFGTGRVRGAGLGNSRAKWGFLPNAHTDFIFAILGEELGLLGTLFVLALFVAFTVLGIRIALHAPDRFGALLAAGITSWITGQALVNMGAVTGMLPVTGVPLPFVSFGGSSLVVTLGAVGVLLNVARHQVSPATSRRRALVEHAAPSLVLSGRVPGQRISGQRASGQPQRGGTTA